MTLKFSKGHGTGNDFVLIFDPKDELDLTPNQVAAICDRSFGIGADGLIKVVDHQGIWFMDYRNADGSLAEICGNGTRVMARYLLENDLISEPTFNIETRAGIVELSVGPTGDISVVLGPIVDQSKEIEVTANGNKFVGQYFSAPNPHVISLVEDLVEPGNLLTAPGYEPTQDLPNGANFEFVRLTGAREVAMRVFERGVGETLSCGSGACAVAVFMQKYWNTTDPITVEVPGGKLLIESLPNQMVKLTGPAVIVASGEIQMENLTTK